MTFDVTKSIDFQTSLMMTIVGLAQNFVGSNNLNFLQPLGQFGTRLHGGKDSASPRYIFTMLRSAVDVYLFEKSLDESAVAKCLATLQPPGPPSFPTH